MVPGTRASAGEGKLPAPLPLPRLIHLGLVFTKPLPKPGVLVTGVAVDELAVDVTSCRKEGCLANRLGLGLGPSCEIGRA